MALAFMVSGSLFFTGPANAIQPNDVIELKGGRELTGKVLDDNLKNDQDAGKGKVFVLVETAAGGKITLEKNKAVVGIKDGEELFGDYRQFINGLSDSPEDHRKAYEWCTKQTGGKIKYAEQMTFHLRRIVAQDANDGDAFRRLGFENVNGKWVNEEQFNTSRGYVVEKGVWRPQLVTQLHEAADLVDQARGDVKQAFSRWKRNAEKLSATEFGSQYNVIFAELKALTNLDTVSFIAGYFDAFDKQRKTLMRDIIMEAVGTVGGQAATFKLVNIAAAHPDPMLRSRAITLLEQPHYDRVRVVDLLSQPGYLRHNDNRVVRQAAYAIGEMGTYNGVLPLIGSIRTTHQFANPNAKPNGAIGGAFDNQGGSGLQLGDNGPKVIKQTVENKEVLDALRRITQTDKGTDPVAWMDWYVENYTLGNVSVRGDN
jgi:hypothetical protein